MGCTEFIKKRLIEKRDWVHYSFGQIGNLPYMAFGMDNLIFNEGAMSQFDFKPIYHRHLPHYQPNDAIFFITFRLYGSLPAEIWRKLNLEKQQMLLQLAKVRDENQKKQLWYEFERRWFAKYDRYMDAQMTETNWLADERIAKIVADSMLFFDGKKYNLYVYTIMPNHVHKVIAPLIDPKHGLSYSLSSILHSLKRHTAKESNKLLGKSGIFWQHENYDHAIRNEKEFNRIMNYTMNNPVKAGLVDAYEKWPWTFCKFL